MIEDNPAFKLLPRKSGIHYEDDTSEVYSLIGRNLIDMKSGTYFIYVGKGTVIVNGILSMSQGSYGCFLDGDIKCTSNSEAILIRAKKYTGIMQFGGPIEYKGRLNYIDGCSDTCIIQPLKLGDPCLNYLHFPENVEQTAHTHPEIRVGYVARGRGKCVTPWGSYPLSEGVQFVILPEGKEKIIGADEKKYKQGTHSFHTSQSILDVVSYHPVTTIGLTDEAHPMVAGTHLAA